MRTLLVALVLASPLISSKVKASAHCPVIVNSPCITNIPPAWQPAQKPGAINFKLQEICLNIADHSGDPDLCDVSGSAKVTGDIAAYVAGVVSNQATQHTNNLDLWVKAPGLETGDTHTIRTVTYMQADTFTYFLGIKNQSDEWYPDVKCAIKLDNPEPRDKCLRDSPTGSAGLFTLSSKCSFNQNKNNSVVHDIGEAVVGTLSAGPVGFVQVLFSLNPSSQNVPDVNRIADLPTGTALEVAVINTCPDDVQSLNNGTGIQILRSATTDKNSARLIAEQWGQEPFLAAHLRGEVPKSILAAKNDSYWRFAKQYYSLGKYWLAIAQANDWKRIVPGTTINLPPMQNVLFEPCYVRPQESLWKAGGRLKQPFQSVGVEETNFLVRPRGRDTIYPLEKLKIASHESCL